MPQYGSGRSQTTSDRLRAACLLFRQAGFRDARLEAEMLYAAALGVDRRRLLSSDLVEASPQELQSFQNFVDRRLKGEPVSYIEGWRGFFGLEFRVDKRVLIPRADSECLVEAALAFLDANSDARVLDVGTGSGCLLLSVLQHRSASSGIGVDRSAGALDVARLNARELGLSKQVHFLQSAWLTSVAPTSIDLVLCNPPYVVPNEELGPGVAEFEPHLALFTPKDDPYFAYQAVCAQAATVLKPGGRMLLEVGRGHAEAVAQIATAHGLQLLQVVADLGGVDRVVEVERP